MGTFGNITSDSRQCAFPGGSTDIQTMALGGTGANLTAIAGGVLYSTATQLAITAAGTSTQVLHGNGAGAPTWGAVALTADVTGVLPVANGGTNKSSWTDGGVVFAGPAGATLEQTAATFFWDYVLERLGIGNNTPQVLLDLGLAGTTAGVLRLAGVTSGNVTIQTAAAAGTWTLTLPVNDGSANEFLKTDGAGVTSWSSVVLTTDVSGTLPVGNGGSGAATLTGIVQGNGAAAFTASIGTLNNVPRWSATGLTTTGSIVDDGTNVGIGTAGALSKLSINGGLHVGGDSDAGDNNLLVDGTGTITGDLTVSGGNIGVGVAVNAGRSLYIGGTPLTGTAQYGIFGGTVFSSAATTSGFIFRTDLSTAAASFTMSTGGGLQVGVPTIGAGSAVTTMSGISIANQGAAGIVNAYGIDILTQSGASGVNVGLRNAGVTILNDNVGLGTTTFGTSAAKVLAIGSGTAPTTSPVDIVQLWSADRGGTAGKASLHLRTEDGTQHVFGDLCGIGTLTPGASAKLQIDSTTSGLLPPRMTKAQRDAIGTPANGLVLYQSDGTAGIKAYVGGAWYTLDATADP